MGDRFSNKIRELRKKKGMTLADLAGKVEISIAFLSDIERGNRRGSSATIGRIAEELGVNPPDLIKRRVS